MKFKDGLEPRLLQACAKNCGGPQAKSCWGRAVAGAPSQQSVPEFAVGACVKRTTVTVDVSAWMHVGNVRDV